MRRTWLLGSIAILLLGCNTPCGALVDETCELHGKGSKACLEAEKLAERRGARDERACRMALDLLRERAAKN